jgi:hypothetical protein
MTYVQQSGQTAFSDDELRRLNVLNSVWRKNNLVRLGYEFDVDITSTFFMIKDTVNNKEMLVTFPGQGATISSFSSYAFYTSAEANKTSFVTITLQDDPFITGIPKVVGYCKWFSVQFNSKF